MKFIKYYFLLIIIASVALFSCSDIQDDITLPAKVSVHGSDVLVKTSAGFHGKQLVGGKMESCQLCHASDYTGGTAKVACNSTQCHPAINVHVAGYETVGSADFHGTYIANSHWNLAQCSQCHGSDYEGGIVSPACTKCHTETGGPEACNTCHGNFNDPTQIAPPQALNNSTDSTYAGVGAHQNHHMVNDLMTTIACNECHIVPEKFDSPGHIDNTPGAQVVFGSFASSGASAPSYDHATHKCSNTYCHGNFEFSKADSKYPIVYTADKITGNNYQPTWNKVDGTEAACGTCHGLPPTGHQESDLKGCATCHIGVVDIYGNIIDKTKHMNGKIDVFGE